MTNKIKDPFRTAEHWTKCPRCHKYFGWNTEDGLAGQQCCCCYQFCGTEKTTKKKINSKTRNHQKCPHVLKGKSRKDYIATTYCDYGNKENRQLFRRHYSLETADNEFIRIVKLYKQKLLQEGWRIWTELFDGTIISDTKRLAERK